MQERKPYNILTCQSNRSMICNFVSCFREIAVRTEGCSPKDLNTLVARSLQSSASRRSFSDQEGNDNFYIFLSRAFQENCIVFFFRTTANMFGRFQQCPEIFQAS